MHIYHISAVMKETINGVDTKSFAKDHVSLIKTSDGLLK